MTDDDISKHSRLWQTYNSIFWIQILILYLISLRYHTVVKGKIVRGVVSELYAEKILTDNDKGLRTDLVCIPW